MKNLFLLMSFLIIFASTSKASYEDKYNLVSSDSLKQLDCLETVLSLYPKQYFYNRKKDPTLSSNLQFGFLAQDLLKVIDNVVLKDSKGYLVDYEQIIPLNTGAIKTLNHKIEVLEETIEIQKASLKETKKFSKFAMAISMALFIFCMVIFLISLNLVKIATKNIEEFNKNKDK